MDQILAALQANGPMTHGQLLEALPRVSVAKYILLLKRQRKIATNYDASQKAVVVRLVGGNNA